jgi:hypothetical protein
MGDIYSKKDFNKKWLDNSKEIDLSVDPQERESLQYRQIKALEIIAEELINIKLLLSERQEQAQE